MGATSSSPEETADLHGGSSDIGLVLARRATAQGARVSILARNPTRLQEAREAIRLAADVDTTVLSADVRDADVVARGIDEVGPIDVLVCNQGVFVPQELELQDLEEIRDVAAQRLADVAAPTVSSCPLHYITRSHSVPSSASPHLSSSSELERELRCQCSDLESSIDDLTRRLSDSIAVHVARSEEAERCLVGVRARLIGLCNYVSRTSSGGAEGGRSEQIWAEELPVLMKEVARVETVRPYVETSLELDNLIGDVEDAVSSSIVGKLIFPHAVNSEEIRMTTIESLKNVEDILTHVTRTRPQWARFISAVDHGVDRALVRPPTPGYR